MKSPFPGMDPFLERYWQDVHSTFMVYAKQQLNDHLPAELLARVEESLAVETDDGQMRCLHWHEAIARPFLDNLCESL